MKEKLDRRKIYTRSVLKDSLLQLLQHKRIASISIKEICETADINRSTFYAHYASQYELLQSIEDDFIQDLVSTLNQYNYSSEDEALLMTERIFEYIDMNSSVCQILLSENSDVYFQKKGMEITKEYIFNNWIGENPFKDDTFEYITMFVVSGFIYVIKNWLENGKSKTPKEMTHIIHNFMNKGLSNVR